MEVIILDSDEAIYKPTTPILNVAQAVAAAERNKLLGMEAIINKRLIGQKEAVSTICKAIRRNSVGFKDSARPVGVFLLAGESGVGKTELCKVLADILYNDSNKLLRLDMSELSSRWDITRLTGSSPGYVAHENGGQLTNMIKENESGGVLLIDEVEKAHPDVYPIFLQVFSDSRLTSSQGETVSFDNILILMTSNLGSKELSKTEKTIGFAGGNNSVITTKEKIMPAIKRTFNPEFINRIDEIVVFNRLTVKDATAICKLMLNKVKVRAKKININVVFDKSTVEELVRLGYDAQRGNARDIQRTITTRIEDMLSDSVLASKIGAGSSCRVVYNYTKGGFSIEEIKKKSASSKTLQAAQFAFADECDFW